MSEVLKAVAKAKAATQGQPAKDVAAAVSEELHKAGQIRQLEHWSEQRHNASCPSGVEARTCYRVNHGDGTYSEPWCDGWFCF